MRLAGVVVAAVLFTAGCVEGGGTRAGNCRAGAAMAAAGRGFAGTPSYAANSVDQLRCDLVAREEREEAARQEARSEQQRAESQARNARLDAELAARRVSPQSPEIGGTPAEADLLCRQQRGSFRSSGDTVGCRIGRDLIFACRFDDSGRFSQCDTYLEQGDIAFTRSSFTKTWGAPTRVSLTPEGFRVFHWAVSEHMTVAVAPYPKGVRISRRLDGVLASEESQ